MKTYRYADSKVYEPDSPESIELRRQYRERLKPKGIKPTQADIGRAVVYRTAPNYEPEQGIITSMNDKYVFVRYGLGSTSAATDPSDLDWLSTVLTTRGEAKE